jgi:hypothetical protein
MELSQRAKDYANAGSVAFYQSLGPSPVILFPADSSRRTHGNFIAESYRAALGSGPWAQRLGKAHAQRHALPDDRQADAKELDSCNSSDALLMNCFCYPAAAQQIFERLLPSLPVGPLEFGVPGNVPLVGGGSDATELDMRAGKVVFESKLTEGDFTERPRSHVERYESLSEVFDVSLLPRGADTYQDYQLIRNVLAATAHGYHFILLCDARRPDLLHEWWHVHGAIRQTAVRSRCAFLLWQEVAAEAPAPLRTFLEVKYGL